MTMSAQPQRYTITAALPYTNGPLHIGHLAGVYIPADIYARYLRGRQKDVAFICGSDEHGVAIAMKAKKEETTPQAIIDHYDQVIRQSFVDFGISFDNYSRTSKPIHHQTAADFFTTLNDKKELIAQESDQLYDPTAEQFLADRFVTGTCPHCNYGEAYGDQCESCGKDLSAVELIDPKSTLSGAKPVIRSTKHWFLPLDRYTSFIEEWIIEGHKDDWKPNVRGQVKSWVQNGLQPRAVTRDLDWGIPVPLADAEGKVLYVWFDAPIGYISSTKEWADAQGKDWETYWKDPNTQLVHFIGKDNIVFHCIIFPIMLKAHGGYILPENVPANEFLNLEGRKISTSKNWAVWLHEYLEEFPQQQDVLRYVLTANAPENKDNDFTWKEFQARNNNELVAIYGNFINRVVVLTHKYFAGKVPQPHAQTTEDQTTLKALQTAPEKIGDAIEHYKFREASQALMNLARLGNKYLADEEPWKKIKTDPDRVATILYNALQIAATLALVSEPLLPFTAVKLKKMLQLEGKSWADLADNRPLLVVGQSLEEASLLFEKIEDESIEKQLEKLMQEDTDPIVPPHLPEVKPDVSYEEFTAMDLRVGTILAAQKVPKADKLLQFQVDLGFEIRTIVSGIAEFFEPEALLGKKVTVMANLAPRTIRGVTSQGMLLLAEDSQGDLVFVSPDPGAENGSVIR
ncbi:MAG: methionine--tRNA ligase [Flavobacteriia bacterium]|nr:methionine--tRNA ligase [Flavobacteriia bacterium]